MTVRHTEEAVKDQASERGLNFFHSLHTFVRIRPLQRAPASPPVTSFGQKLKMLTILDEYTQECLEIRVEPARGKEGKISAS